MTDLEAVEILTLDEQMQRELPNLKEVYEVAVKALEKQIPKKPLVYQDTNRADCPVCGATVRGIKEPFGDWCNKCGQALDWSG